MSQNTQALKAAGYLDFRELAELIEPIAQINADTVRDWLPGPLGKVRVLLVMHELIVLPTDRSWACLYSPKLVEVLASYLRWHRFGGRHTAVEVADFFKELVEQPRRARLRAV